MARKKREQPHENLERWLVSYADFMTLLFATFVVLYALSQVDVSDFAKLEEALKQAFRSMFLTGRRAFLTAQTLFLTDTTEPAARLCLSIYAPDTKRILMKK